MYSKSNQRYNKQYSELCSRSLCIHNIKEITCNWLYAVNGGRPVMKPVRIYTVYGTILLDLSELNSPGSKWQCMRMYTAVLVNCLAYSLMF
jgi:hypothetical protein